jgi:hypothetical protein
MRAAANRLDWAQVVIAGDVEAEPVARPLGNSPASPFVAAGRAGAFFADFWAQALAGGEY